MRMYNCTWPLYHPKGYPPSKYLLATVLPQGLSTSLCTGHHGLSTHLSSGHCTAPRVTHLCSGHCTAPRVKRITYLVATVPPQGLYTYIWGQSPRKYMVRGAVLWPLIFHWLFTGQVYTGWSVSPFAILFMCWMVLHNSFFTQQCMEHLSPQRLCKPCLNLGNEVPEYIHVEHNRRSIRRHLDY